MKIKMPKYIMGSPIEGSLDRVLAGNNQIAPAPVNTPSAPTPANIADPQNYIILEGKTHGSYSYQDTLVAMNTTHKGKNWNDSQNLLAQEGAQMLTIRQYVDFLNLLKSGKTYRGDGQKLNGSMRDTILDEILTVRNPWRSEWLDADFKVIDRNIIGMGGKFVMNYEHRIINGQLKAQRSEEVKGYLAKDKKPGIDLDDWLQNATYQGLPSENIKNGNLWYWQPGRDNNSVARFSANSGRASLVCDRNPSGTDSSLGVRAARKKI